MIIKLTFQFNGNLIFIETKFLFEFKFKNLNLNFYLSTLAWAAKVDRCKR